MASAPRHRRWSPPNRHGSWPYLLLLGVLFGGAVGQIWPHNPAAWSLVGRAFPEPAPQAVLVDIDADSLAEYGPLNTWTPELYRSAFSQLQEAGVRATGLDVVIDPTRADAPELNNVFTQAGVVVAALPGMALPAMDSVDRGQVRAGISALDYGILGITYAFRAGYRTADGQMLPTLAWQLAHAAGTEVPLDSQLRFLHHFTPPVLDTRLSFRDVVAGQFRYADVQDKVVVIGQASPDPLRPAGSELQVRAVASLLAPPYFAFPTWAVVLMSALAAGAGFMLGRAWALLAVLLTALLAVLWQAGVAFPGVTLTAAALIGLQLAGLEYLLARRGVRLHSTLGEQLLSSPAGLTRAIEAFLVAPGSQGPAYLFLVHLEGYGLLEERFGREWAEEGIDQSLRRLTDLGPEDPSLEGCGFRWDQDELAFLVAPVPSDDAAREIAAHLAFTLKAVSVRGQPLRPSAGYARIETPAGTLLDEVTAHSVVEAARRTLLPAPVSWD